MTTYFIKQTVLRTSAVRVVALASPPLSKLNLKQRTFSRTAPFREVGGIKEADMRIIFKIFGKKW